MNHHNGRSTDPPTTSNRLRAGAVTLHDRLAGAERELARVQLGGDDADFVLSLRSRPPWCDFVAFSIYKRETGASYRAASVFVHLSDLAKVASALADVVEELSK